MRKQTLKINRFLHALLRTELEGKRYKLRAYLLREPGLSEVKGKAKLFC